MSNFTPVREKAQWEFVYDTFVGVLPGEIVSYETLGTAVQFDPETQRNRIQQAVGQAAKRLLKDKRLAVEAVRGVGYRVVPANEHVRLSKKQQSRASRAIQRGSFIVQHTDLNGLTEIEKSLVRATGRAFSLQSEAIRRLDVRQTNVEGAVRDHEAQLEEHASLLSNVEDRLRAAGL